MSVYDYDFGPPGGLAGCGCILLLAGIGLAVVIGAVIAFGLWLYEHLVWVSS